MSDYSITKSRTLQWVVIIVVLFTLAGAYWYFQARAAVNLKAVNETGLVGYWPMNEGAGTRASDFSGSGNTGTLTNGPTWVDGKFGKAVSFNGTNKAIDLGKHLFKTIQVGSLSVWVKSNSFTGSQIVYEAATWNAALSLAWPTASNASLSAMLGSNTAINGSKNNFALNTWYHVVLTWDGTHVIFYVNGAVDNNLTDSGVPNNSVGSDNTQIGRFSYAGASSTGGYFNGSIDDVRIYSRALSATEITNLYALGTATVNASQNTSLTTGLVGQWSFNGQDISGTTAYDRSGADNNGTLTNGPAKVPGKIGQALTFNGSTNYVSVPNASSLNPTNVTVAAWVKTSTTGGYIIAKDPPNDLSAGQVASSVTASAEKQPVNLLGQSLTIKNIAVSITAYKNISILLALFLLSIFGLGFYKSKQKKISANSIVSAMVIFVLLISPFLFSSYATAAGGCSPSSRYWVGGTGTWDASDTTHWSTTSGGAGGASVPLAMNSVAIFDASSGGGAVTLGFSPSILSIIMGAFTGTFDAATFSPTLNACSSTAFSGTGTGTRTLNMGSGTWTVSSGSSPGNPWDITNATNLTLNAQTSTVKIISSSGTTAYNFTFAGGNQIYNNVWFARGTDTGNNVVSGSNTFNNFKDDGSVAHILIFTAGTTQTVSTFTVSGTAGNVITLGSGATATHALVKTGGGTISSDYLDIRHSVATPASTWYAGTHSTDNQATATAGSGWTFTDAPAGGPANMPYALSTVDGGQFMIISGGTTYTVTSSVPVTDNQWHYVVGTYNGTSMKIYVDGMETGTSNSFSGNLPTTKTGAVHIGADYNTTPANFFTGSIDDARLYNRALSAGEIQSLYAQGGGTTINTSENTTMTNNLVGMWSFNGQDMNGTTAYDRSGSSHNGTLTNGPVVLSGKVGQSLNFGGTNQYVSIGNVYNGVKSISFWIKPDNTTKKIIDLNGTANIEVIGQTITVNGFTSPTIYVDGVASSMIDTNWHFVTITTGTGLNASAVDIGRVSSGYFDGRLDEVRMYSEVLTASQIVSLYNLGGPVAVATGGFVCGTSTVTGLDSLTYNTVTGADGKCWFATNLGTTNVGTSYSDSTSYGSLYQWGRLRDLHQATAWDNIGTLSGTTGTLSTGDVPGNANFITGYTDWRSPQNNNLWGDVNKTNNVCPAGWHVPTQLQWATWTNAAGLTSGAGVGTNGTTLCSGGSGCLAAAYATNLKLPSAGYRNYSNGSLDPFQGSYGRYWSSSPSGPYAWYLYFNASNVYPAATNYRAFGFSVRCVKD